MGPRASRAYTLVPGARSRPLPPTAYPRSVSDIAKQARSSIARYGSTAYGIASAVAATPCQYRASRRGQRRAVPLRTRDPSRSYTGTTPHRRLSTTSATSYAAHQYRLRYQRHRASVLIRYQLRRTSVPAPLPATG
eukprot:2196990-Rhodomonas_salina.4